MNKKQLACAKAMEKLLARCDKAGLQGGVYAGNFCLWPVKAKHPAEGDDSMFFANVEEVGVIISTNMTLDGGAGC